MLKLPYYLACGLMLVELMTIAMCLAIEAIAVHIIYLLLDASFMCYSIARHVSSEYLD
jgi:hypothetical protein